jgi:hypothetical protein
MDPLSVTASIVGLILSVAQVTSGVSIIQCVLSDAPRIDQLLSQITEIETCLSTIQKFLDNIRLASRERMVFIKVEHLVATLTQAVLTFSELEALVKKTVAGPRNALILRINWTRRQNRLANIMLRLESHKSALSLMLSIVQWSVGNFYSLYIHCILYRLSQIQHQPSSLTLSNSWCSSDAELIICLVNPILKPPDYQKL